MPGVWGTLGLSLVAAAVFTPLVVLESTRSGRLTCPPVFDDVAYMLDAAKRLATFRGGGAGAFLAELADWPPHAPFSSLLAGVAVLLFGHTDWGPYAMNGVVAALWFGLLAYVVRRRPLWERGAVLLLAAFLPMTHMAVREFRPDMLAATLLAWAVVVALEGPLVSMSRRRLAAIGAVLGLAVVAKGSTSPATMATLGACCAVAAMVEARPPWGRYARRTALAAGIILGIGGLVAAPYLAIAAGDIHAYIYDNIFGDRKDIWAVPGSAEFHLRYYIDGVGGRFQLGGFAFPMLACVVLGAAAAPFLGARGQGRRSLALAAAILAAYAVASWNVMKQPFLGLQFQALLAVAAVLSLRMFMEKGPRLRGRVPWASVAVVIMAVAAGATFSWPNPWASRDHPKIVASMAAYREIDRVIRERIGDGPAMVFVTFVSLVNETNLELAAVRRGAEVNCATRIGARSLAEIARDLGRAELVVAAQSGTGITNDQFPCAAIYDETVRFLDADPRRVRICEIPGLDPERKVIVYARRPAPPPRPITAAPTSPSLPPPAAAPGPPRASAPGASGGTQPP